MRIFCVGRKKTGWENQKAVEARAHHRFLQWDILLSESLLESVTNVVNFYLCSCTFRQRLQCTTCGYDFESIRTTINPKNLRLNE